MIARFSDAAANHVYERMRGEGFVCAGNFEPFISPIDGAILQADCSSVQRS